jgi:hypothetical protein
MNDAHMEPLLPGGREVPFSQVETTLARIIRDGEERGHSLARGATGTVVATGTRARLVAAALPMAQLADSTGVRAILISEGTESSPLVRITPSAIVIEGLAPRYLDNAVAALRLPCLPAMIWWRGGSVQALHDLADLADRLVLDTDDPDPIWTSIDALLSRTALTDVRWTRLTRWRALLAHLFDLPQVRAAIPTFRRVLIDGYDRSAARLYAAWLASSLHWAPDVDIQIRPVSTEGRSVLESVELTGDHLSIAVRMLPGCDCLEASVEGERADVRVSPIGPTTLSAWMCEELAVRSRDLSFERALGALRRVGA